MESLLRWLTERGFHHTTAVELPGEFCHRGGILDIFAPDWYQPLRFELFDDEIESIRRFDVSSQRSLEKLNEANVTVVAAATSDHGHLADYLPPNSWFLLVEPSRIQKKDATICSEWKSTSNFIPSPAYSLSAAVSRSPPRGQFSKGPPVPTCHLPIESVERFSGDIGKVKDELDRLGEGQASSSLLKPKPKSNG